MNRQQAQDILRGYMSPREHAINEFVQIGKIQPIIVADIARNIRQQKELALLTTGDAADECWTNVDELKDVSVYIKRVIRDQLNRSLERSLKQRMDDWKDENPNHCPECFCRPGYGDADDGTDHEKFCSHKES